MYPEITRFRCYIFFMFFKGVYSHDNKIMAYVPSQKLKEALTSNESDEKEKTEVCFKTSSWAAKTVVKMGMLSLLFMNCL